MTLKDHNRDDDESRLGNYEPRVENDIIKNVLKDLSLSSDAIVESSFQNYTNRPIRRNSNSSDGYIKVSKKDLRPANYSHNTLPRIESKNSYYEAPQRLLSDILTQEFKNSI